MAKKTLSTRQKLVFRLTPSLSKPRNLVAITAQKSGAGSHQKSVSSLRQAGKRALKKTPIEVEPD
ncbi:MULTISPECIES: hypothetical protein [Undibacterium]|jgi:hypothetical protein|uniref:Uncharacterized protein n=1 Tax=Undibacterium parvum TaxID=401471 RepID=A0A3Q9BPN6_9BURK|nr:hypothetical protein [Undibacterium parvum]AZP11675.1 hypothetical protein EJN92_06505 [Undibacterium parvum]MCX7220003.1 hypothetical protein [Burkholderiales bacterium]